MALLRFLFNCAICQEEENKKSTVKVIRVRFAHTHPHRDRFTLRHGVKLTTLKPQVKKKTLVGFCSFKDIELIN